MPISPTHRTGVLMLAAGMLLAIAASASSAQEISQSEKILFQSNHFGSIKQSTRIAYAYHQESAAPDAFDDAVTLTVTHPNADGTASVAAQFLTGSHAIAIAPIDHAQGNPAILGFLERDIAEMKRLTGGSTNYFRKRIRLALAAPEAAIKTITVNYAGHPVAAQEISVRPYVDDPLKERFGKFAGKGYVFVISDAVPGSVFQVYTTLPADHSAATIATTMTIQQKEPAPKKIAGPAT
ncbi:hypothetical protein [Actimicrobium sp. CCI2.3]|uniref:hypothetical protein n=1 Tax=Actimicrobium sp. CCI2.3 TaxID=3048616 RepID=UPI002AB5D325|nr:hypothetical protein [Actimicrobium sp. CCI2.3]MDY7575157.1 hypothetical protein [Actimicrobium sp. CCI2.3]MEB0023590.1 hypothetical protein [Actimicrobium sp. CCI2.3]